MIVRNDLRSPASVPKDLKKAIKEAGGTNPFKEPLFRLCLAQDRITRAAGAWTKWADDVPVGERGDTGVDIVQGMLRQYRELMTVAHMSGMTQHGMEEMSKKLSEEIDDTLKSRLTAAPLSVEEGMRDVQIYPFEGWILEKWKPAEAFGSPADWESFKFQGVCALGPYPTHGEYEIVAGPTPYLPSADQVRDAIRQNLKAIDTRPASARERVALMMARVEQHQKDKKREAANKAEAFRKETGTIMNRVSLGAGRVRQEMAEKAGLSGHYGN
jgi:hypothetical protein